MKLIEFVQEQMQERYKHFIIHGPSQQGKTKLAKYISERFNAIYIDLLEEFYKDLEKKNIIDIFGPSKLIAYINEFNRDKKFIVIDQMDFLLNTWDDSQFREFLVSIDRNQSAFCCMFVMQNHRVLEREALIKENDKGNKRLINIYHIDQGGTING